MSDKEIVEEKTIETNIEEKKKKHPIKKFFKIVFVFVFIVIIAAIGLSIYLGVNIVSTENYNGNQSVQTIKKENKSIKYVSNYILYDSIDNVNSDKLASISLDETNMNYLLHAVSKEIHLGALNVDNMYMYYPTEENTTYELYMPMSVFVFKTCLYGSIDMKYDNENDLIIMNIKELKLGKLSTENWLVKTMFNFLRNDLFEEAFNDVGLKANVSINAPSINISISGKSLFDMIFTKTDGDAVDLAKIVYSNLYRNDKITFDFSNKIGINCNLDDSISNELSDNTIENSIEGIKNKMNTLITKGIVNETNCSLVWKYLLNGYSILDDSSKNSIKKLDLSAISLNNEEEIETYSGVIDRSADNYIFDIGVREILELRNEEEPAIIFNVPDSYVNSKLREKSIIGSTIALLDKSKTKFNYIIIENIYIVSTPDKISINILIDINGSEINFKLDFAYQSGDDKLVTSLSNVSMGNIGIISDDYKTILDFINSNCNLDFLIIDSNANNITLDFSILFGTNLKEVIELFNLNTKYSLTDGAIVISIKK